MPSIGVPCHTTQPMGSGGEQRFALGSKLQEMGILNKDTGFELFDFYQVQDNTTLCVGGTI